MDEVDKEHVKKVVFEMSKVLLKPYLPLKQFKRFQAFLWYG